jgi:hypothetical protein
MAKKNKRKQDTVSLPVQHLGTRAASGLEIRAATANEDARTVDFVWSTGAQVRRHGPLPDGSGYGAYIEELSMDEKAVDLSRLNGGAPILNTHSRWDLSDVLGVVVKGSARIQKGVGTGTAKFSERDDADGVFADIVAGVICNVSVGYSVQAYEVTREEGELPVFKATKWTPVEVSAVPIGADAAAGFRAEGEVNPCTITNAQEKGVSVMATKGKKTAADAANKRADVPGDNAEVTPVTPVSDGADESRNQPESNGGVDESRAKPTGGDVDVAAQVRETVDEIRAADMQIRTICRQAGLGDERADKLIADGKTVDQARAIVFDEMVEKSGGEVRGQNSVGFSNEDPAVMRVRMAEAQAARYTGAEISEESRQYAGASIRQIAEVLLEARGQKAGRFDTTAAVIERAMGVSDFPILLTETGSRMLMPSYEATPSTYQHIARETTNMDFRAKALIRDGDFPELLPVNEHGELKHGSMSESKETIQLVTVGRKVKLTRNALINDDLGAFSEMATKAGQAARRHENKTVWDIVINNAKLSSDNKALFHADHSNLAASGGGIAAATVGAGKKSIRTQKSPDGNTLNYTPSIIAAPAALETTVEQYLASVVVPTKSSDVVPESHKRLEPVIEPLLDAGSETAWFLFTNPTLLAAIIYARLEGQAGPQMRQGDVGFGGIDFEIIDDFAAAAVEPRAGYKNAGA